MRTPSIFILGTLLLWIPEAHAQKSGIGIKGGVLGSSSRSEAIHYDPVIGGVFGAYFPLGIGKRFELQPELLVTMQGAAFTDEEKGQYWVDRSIYLHVPISAKFYLSNTFNLQAGFQAGRLMTSWRQNDVGTEASMQEKKRYDLGFILGMGVDFRSGWDLGIRYYSGISATLINDDKLYPRNHNLLLSLGYRVCQFKKHFAQRRG